MTPKFSMILNLVAAVLMVTVASSADLTEIFGPHNTSIVIHLCAYFGSLIAAMNAAMHATSPPIAGPMATSTVPGSVKIALLLLAPALLLMSAATADAQTPVKKHVRLAAVQTSAPRLAATVPTIPTPRPASTAPKKAEPLQLKSVQANPVLALQTFTVADLTAAKADADAQTPPDLVSSQCYAALIPLVETGVGNPFPTGLGGFQLLQKARDAKAALANIQSPNGPLSSLNIACAPLVLDVQHTLIQLGIVGGGIAASGGLTLPFTLPGIFGGLGGLLPGL